MRVSGISAPTELGVDHPRRRDGVTGSPQPAAGSAVIPLAPPAAASPATRSEHRPTAPFLAHLIATKDGLPQTRERRRAEPIAAANLYGAAAAVTVRPSPGAKVMKLT